MMIIFIWNPNAMEKTEIRRVMECHNIPFFTLFGVLIQIIIAKFVTRLESFFKSNPFLNNLKARAEECFLDSAELCQNDTNRKNPVSVESRVLGGHDHGSLRREEAETIMKSLGLFCSPESEPLGESLGRDEFSKVFDDNEPSFEEIKEAFDVFDENRDGFIDPMELQRVLGLLGLRHGSNIEHCKRMINRVDVNNDGKIDFHEFVKFMETIFC